MSNRAVFLDRDGTINIDSGYIGDPELIELFPGAADAINLLNEADLKVIIITNQSGIGRGLFTDSALKAVNRRVIELLETDGARIDAIYYCPHLPSDACHCRKPKTVLLKKAAADFDIDVERSYVVGDKCSDIGLGKNAGAKTVLVLTGLGGDTLESGECKPDHTATDILSAATGILADIDSETKG